MFESIKIDDLRDYSIVLSRVLEAILILINLRKEDIVQRKEAKMVLLKERNEQIRLSEERKEKRLNYLEDLKAEWEQNETEDKEEFNEEELLKIFDKDNFEIEIPEEVIFDIDNDINKEEEEEEVQGLGN
jgi:hypothetical protein